MMTANDSLVDEILSGFQEGIISNDVPSDAVPISKFYEVLGVTEGNPVMLLANFLGYLSSISSYYYLETTVFEESSSDGEVRYYESPDSTMLEVMHLDAFFGAGNPHPFVDAFVEAIKAGTFCLDFLFYADTQRELTDTVAGFNSDISFKFQQVNHRDRVALTVSVTFEQAMVPPRS
jgi:hypothetical protein